MKRVKIWLACFFAIACFFFLFLLLKHFKPSKQPVPIHTPEASADAAATPTADLEQPSMSPTPTVKPSNTPADDHTDDGKTPEPTTEPSPEPTPEETPEVTDEPQTPVYTPLTLDFEALSKMNGDIYAWLDIPGAGISYAVLQSETDDTFYLDHEEHGWSSANGALFTESRYNSKDFQDPVTIIYGHHMKSGAMFGNLQTFYSSAWNFSTYDDIYIMMPDAEYHYHVFAAIPFEGYHILYAYDFSDAKTFDSFFSYVLSTRVLGSNVESDCELTPDDRVLILSTCLQGNNKNRFLVMAKLLDD